jgi:DNA-binding PadR family transcriptional regulator
VGRRSDGNSSLALRQANAWLPNHAGNERPYWWSLAPEPGAIYPTIAQLEDEGLVTTREEGGRRLVTLTSEGSARLEERSARLGDPFADFADAPDRPDLRDLLHRLHAAVCQIEVGGDATRLEAAANVLVQARRSLYLILAGEAENVGE